MKLFVIGYMGCGKSSIGRPLSGLMNAEFIDLDSYIEQRSGMTIPTIFATHGENRFREIERELLLELCADDRNCVIATGGGTPCYKDNMDRMNQSGITVYIDLDQGIICSRLAYSKKKRPLIDGMNEAERRAFIEQSLLAREPFYKQATIRMSGKSIKASDVFLLIENYNGKIL